MATRYYRRDGTPYEDVLDWARDFEQYENKIVAKAILPDGKMVSTVWMGLDHNFRRYEPPLIFETMVFGSADSYDEVDTERYSTEAEAIEGHKQMVSKWSSQ